MAQLLPFGKNKRPSYLNSTSGFDFDHMAVIRMTFCINLPNFIHIGAPNAEIYRHVQDSGRGNSILLPFSCLLMSLSSSQTLSANQISSTLSQFRTQI